MELTVTTSVTGRSLDAYDCGEQGGDSDIAVDVMCRSGPFVAERIQSVSN